MANSGNSNNFDTQLNIYLNTDEGEQYVNSMKKCGNATKNLKDSAKELETNVLKNTEKMINGVASFENKLQTTYQKIETRMADGVKIVTKTIDDEIKIMSRNGEKIIGDTNMTLSEVNGILSSDIEDRLDDTLDFQNELNNYTEHGIKDRSEMQNEYDKERSNADAKYRKEVIGGFTALSDAEIKAQSDSDWQKYENKQKKLALEKKQVDASSKAQLKYYSDLERGKIDMFGNTISQQKTMMENFARYTAHWALRFGMMWAAFKLADMLKAWTFGFTDYVREVKRASEVTGMATEEFQKMEYAARINLITQEQLIRYFDFMNKAISEFGKKTGDATPAFERLKISYQQITKLKAEDQFYLIADALTKISSQSEKADIIKAIFGREGRYLMPMLRDGAEGIKKLGEEFKRFGGIVSDETIYKAFETAKFQENIRTMLQAAKIQFGNFYLEVFAGWRKLLGEMGEEELQFRTSKKAKEQQENNIKQMQEQMNLQVEIIKGSNLIQGKVEEGIQSAEELTNTLLQLYKTDKITFDLLTKGATYGGILHIDKAVEQYWKLNEALGEQAKIQKLANESFEAALKGIMGLSDATGGLEEKTKALTAAEQLEIDLMWDKLEIYKNTLFWENLSDESIVRMTTHLDLLTTGMKEYNKEKWKYAGMEPWTPEGQSKSMGMKFGSKTKEEEESKRYGVEWADEGIDKFYGPPSPDEWDYYWAEVNQKAEKAEQEEYARRRTSSPMGEMISRYATFNEETRKWEADMSKTIGTISTQIQTTLVTGIQQFCDALGNAVVNGGKFGDVLKDILKQMLASLVSIIAQALIFLGIMTLMNLIVPNSGTAFCTAIAAAGGALQQGAGIDMSSFNSGADSAKGSFMSGFMGKAGGAAFGGILGGLFDKGGFAGLGAGSLPKIPQAAKGMVTYGTKPIPAILHPNEVVLPMNYLKDFFGTMGERLFSRSIVPSIRGGGGSTATINLYVGAGNFDDPSYWRKLYRTRIKPAMEECSYGRV